MESVRLKRSIASRPLASASSAYSRHLAERLRALSACSRADSSPKLTLRRASLIVSDAASRRLI